MEVGRRHDERLRAGVKRSGWRCQGSLLPRLIAFSLRFAVSRCNAYGEDHAVSCTWALVEIARCYRSECGLSIVSGNDDVGAGTDFFLNHQNPRDVGDINCLNSMGIIDKVRLDSSVAAGAV